jgi:membrane-bound serine protease (ClpP class)
MLDGDWSSDVCSSDLQGKVVLDTQGARRINVAPGFRDKLLEFLANPNLAYLLLMIGLLAVYFELSHPGAILPGVVGAIALILAFMAMQTLSVSLAGVLLILVGVVLFIIELKVQSYGLLPLAGIGCLTVGSIMLFEKTEEGIRLAWTTIIPTVAVVSAFFIGVLVLVWRAQRRKPVTGAEGLLGLPGEVVVWSGGQGKVFVHGELWRAKGESSLNPHDKIQVTGQEGLTLLVKPAGKEA